MTESSRRLCGTGAIWGALGLILCAFAAHGVDHPREALWLRLGGICRLCAAGAADRIATHLRQCGMKAHPKDAGVMASGQRLVEHMMHDKKMEGGKLPFLLARGIGKTFLARDVALDSVAAFLDRTITQG